MNWRRQWQPKRCLLGGFFCAGCGHSAWNSSFDRQPSGSWVTSARCQCFPPHGGCTVPGLELIWVRDAGPQPLGRIPASCAQRDRDVDLSSGHPTDVWAVAPPSGWWAESCVVQGAGGGLMSPGQQHPVIFTQPLLLSSLHQQLCFKSRRL